MSDKNDSQFGQGPQDERQWLDGDGTEVEAEGAIVEPTVSLDVLLTQLISDAELPPLQELYALSDLSRSEMEAVRRSWSAVPAERRLQIVRILVEVAEEDLNLHLSRLLRIAMADSEAQVRQAAVEGLWEDNDPSLIGPYVQMLHGDPDVEVRSAVASALGTFVLSGELEELEPALAMRVEEALLAVLHDEREPVDVRRRALESIAYSSEAGVQQLIEDAYYAPDEDMRISSLTAMGRSADIRWRGFAHAELQNPSAAMRVEAAWACGELEARSALDDLLALLDDEEQDVRLSSIMALGRMGGREARDALETIYAGENPDESMAAELALEEMAYYAGHEDVPLLDESEAEDEWEHDPWDSFFDRDDRDLGSYE